MSKEMRSPGDVPGDTQRPHWQRVEEALEEQHRNSRRMRRALRRQRRMAKAAQQAAGPLPTVFVTDTLARLTVGLLKASTPSSPPPSVVYWFGFECGERAAVSTVVVPEKEGHADAVLASAVADEEVFQAIVNASLIFLGQVRFADPDADDTPDASRDVRFDGAFYIEIPSSDAAVAKLDLESCRVYRQIAGSCRRVAVHEFDHHLRMIPGFKDLRDPREMPRVISLPIRNGV